MARPPVLSESRRPSGWQEVTKEGEEKRVKEAEKELARIQRLFKSLYDSEVGQEFEGMLWDETARNMLAMRGARSMEEKEYSRGRWDLAEEFLSFKRGMDRELELVKRAVERALKAKEKK
mgnify:FL=1